MITLPLILLFLMRDFRLTRASVRDDSFNDTHRSMIGNAHDKDTINKIVCNLKQENNFTKYNINDFNYDKKEYEYCDLKKLRLAQISKMNHVRNVVPKPTGYFHLMNRGYKFLRDSKFIYDSFPTIKDALNKYHVNIENSKNDVFLCQSGAAKLSDENRSFLLKYSYMIRKSEKIENKKNELTSYISLINEADTSCTDEDRDNMNHKMNLEKIDLNEQIREMSSFITDTFKEFQQACELEPTYPIADPIISKVYNTFQEILKALNSVNSDVNNEIKRFEDKLNRHNEVKTNLNEISPENLENALRKLKDYVINFKNLRDTTEKEKKQVELVISQISAELVVLPADSQSLLQITLENLNNHLKNYINMKQDTKEELKIQKYVESKIKETELKHTDIYNKLNNYTKNIELTFDVLKILNNLEYLLDYRREHISLSSLKTYIWYPRNYSLDTNLEEAVSFLQLHKTTKTQLDQILTEISEHTKQIIDFQTRLKDIKTKLVDQFNSLKSKPIPEITTPKPNIPLIKIEELDQKIEPIEEATTVKPIPTDENQNHQDISSENQKNEKPNDVITQETITPKIQIITEEKSVNVTMLSSVIVAVAILAIAIGGLVFIRTCKRNDHIIQHETKYIKF